MPALRGGGIHHDLPRGLGLGDRPAAEQARAVIKHRRLAGGHAKLGLGEADPFAVARRGYRRRERADFHADFALILGEPVPVGDTHRLDRKRSARADHDPRLLRIDPDDVQRFLLATDLDSPPLADGEVDDAAMAAEDPAGEIDDLSRRFRFWTHALHQARIIAIGNEADVLAVGLCGDLELQLGSDPPDLVLRQLAERKAQEFELLARRSIEEIALVAARVGALLQLDPVAIEHSPHIMAGGEAVGPELPREGDEIDELHALVPAGAWYRRPPTRIFLHEPADHALAEPALVIEHVMSDAEPVGDGLGVIDVLPRAARARSARGLAMVVELERHADDLGTGLGGERSRDRAVDAARHGDDDSGIARRAAKLKIDPHW